jgi:cell wall-associated NlpC family hydrolase
VLHRHELLTDAPPVRRTVLVGISAGLTLLLLSPVAGHALASSAHHPTPDQLAQLNVANLDAAAMAVEQQALASGALVKAPHTWSGAKILLRSAEALTSLAMSNDPSRAPVDTTAIMGPVPRVISHHLRKRPHHVHITATHTLSDFVAAVADGGSKGLGHNHKHDGATPAPFQAPDGLWVDPPLPAANPSTIGMVALRAALRELGQPYVWGGAGPLTFDCSGLVQWAYAHAGLRLAHHAADQWNEGRLIPGKDILPGDLIMFGRPIFHVGMYLGAGWMLNAPYTGQWVNVVPVSSHVTGVIRP